jgi:hypothetical protein
LDRLSAARDGIESGVLGDLADALAFALRFEGRKRVHNAGEIMARIVAKRLVDHLERAGFVVMQRPLATVHKARLQWLDATDAMLAESRAFLFDHGYEAGLNIRAYTSNSRDATRAKLGLAPLKVRE